MDMKKRLFTLAGMLGLSLLTSVTLAGKPGQDPLVYLPSEKGVQPISGVIKKCTAGTLFKNVDPFISGGNPDPSDFPILRAESFLVDGSEVELIVAWNQDNSFSYAFAESKEGLMWEIGVENNSDKIIYKNDDPDNPNNQGPLTSDSGLNKVANGVSDKANHIDICISPLDTTPPGIVFESPRGGDTVSGDSVTVTVLVTDEESGLATDANGNELVFLSVDDGVTEDVQMTCTAVREGTEGQFRCTYDWSTLGLAAGTYTLSVTATDGAVPDQNPWTESIKVEFQFSLADCFGDLDDGDFLPSEPQGCNPTLQLNLQAPFGANEPETKYIFGEVIQATDSAKLNVRDCGPDALPDPRMEYNVDQNRWEPNPDWVGVSGNVGWIYAPLVTLF